MDAVTKPTEGIDMEDKSQDTKTIKIYNIKGFYREGIQSPSYLIHNALTKKEKKELRKCR